MYYSLQDLNILNLRNLAIPNKRYFGEDGKVYVGTKEGRLLLEDNASNVTFDKTDSIDANNVQDAIEDISDNSDENAQDAVGSILTNTSTISLTYSDSTPSISANLLNTSVTAGVYGSSVFSPQITIDAQGRITSAVNVSVASPTLANVLIAGNTTGARDIIVNTGQQIKGQTDLLLSDSTGNNYYYASSSYIFQQWYDGLGTGNTDFILQGNGTEIFSHTFLYLECDTGKYNFYQGSSYYGETDFTTLTANRSYIFPNQSGTIALISDLTTGYVPYTGATTSVNLNTQTLISGAATIQTLTVGLGASSLSGNTVLGVSGLAANTIGDFNTAIGYQTLLANTTGEGTVAIGYQTLKDQTIYGYNIGIGYQAMQYLQDGYNNIAIGTTALEVNISGTDNVVIGNSAMVLNTSSFNVAIGNYAGGQNITGYGNVFIGNRAGQRETGNNKLYITNSGFASEAVGRTSALIYGEFGTFPSTQTLNVNGVLNVQFAANISGQITGNLTGNVTGNVSGTALNVTGIVLPANGGTGIANNNSSTLTISGAFATTLTVSATTSITLPDSGTLYGTKAGSITSAQLLSSLTDETGTAFNVFSDSPTFTGTPTLPTGTIAVTQIAGNNTTAIATTAFVQQEKSSARAFAWFLN